MSVPNSSIHSYYDQFHTEQPIFLVNIYTQEIIWKNNPITPKKPFW